jgi:hypothetical protein
MPKKPPLGRLSDAEKAYIIANRERIELDNRDWEKEPLITRKDLMTMSSWRASILLADTARWKLAPDYDVYLNTKLEKQR